MTPTIAQPLAPAQVARGPGYRARFIDLVTFRRTGEPVGTPVLFVQRARPAAGPHRPRRGQAQAARPHARRSSSRPSDQKGRHLGRLVRDGPGPGSRTPSGRRLASAPCPLPHRGPAVHGHPPVPRPAGRHRRDPARRGPVTAPTPAVDALHRSGPRPATTSAAATETRPAAPSAPPHPTLAKAAILRDVRGGRGGRRRATSSTSGSEPPGR